jgi:antitoxin HicB
MWSYPIELTPDDNDTVMVSFPDVLGAFSFGNDDDEAMLNAQDALEVVFSGLIADRKDIPKASPARGRRTVSPTLLGSLKLEVYNAMRARGWRKADLARQMGLNPRQIDRLLDLRHATTVAQLDQAFAVCGRRVEVGTRELKAA